MLTLKEKFVLLLDAQKERLFQIYYEMLIDYNSRFNLTAITEKEDVYLKHFADSSAASEIAEGSVLDIGAGAGFPSLPLKIIKPSLQVTMADSLNKRVSFLKDVIERLGLTGISAVHTRAEDMKKDALYDTAVARAVAPLNTLCEYMLPFVKEGGKMIAYKSAKAEEEVEQSARAVEILGGGKPRIIPLMLDEDTPRTLVVINKIKPTPSKYPRGGNKPKSAPL